MISYTTSNSEEELYGILQLQKSNLPNNILAEEKQNQGFVTVEHTYQQLKKLNDVVPHIIAKDNEKVVGYVLAMTKASKTEIPILIPMFEVFDQLKYDNQVISAYNYMVVGQVCVEKEYRGQGIFDAIYNFYRKQLEPKFEFAITEIAAINFRSLKAHQRVGFKEVYPI